MPISGVNIHLERPDDRHTRSLFNILNTYGLSSHVNNATHNRGGSLDIVATRSDLPPVSVFTTDPGISDHCLLRWDFFLARPLPVYTSTTTRPWRNLDESAFRTALAQSALCQPSTWSSLDLDQLQ